VDIPRHSSGDPTILWAMEIFTYAHWSARGLSKSALERALETGLVWRVLKSVYADGSVPDCLDTRARAIGLVRPRETAIGRETAAWLAGLDVLPPGSSIVDEPIRLVVPPDVTPPRLPGCRSYQAPLPGSDLVEDRGVLRTTDLRTALDLGRFCLRVGWRRRRVGAEYDGAAGHDSKDQAQHDERRRVAMRREDDWDLVVARKGDLWGRRAARVERTAHLLLDAGWSPSDATILEQIARAVEFEARTGQQWQWMPVGSGAAA
jgi:hypothetical protein